MSQVHKTKIVVSPWTVLLLAVFLPLTHSFDCLSEGSAAFAAYLK